VDAQPGTPVAPIDTDAAPRVLVGVDGSAGSLTALRWAMHWALVRGAEVAVVATYPTVATWSSPDSVDPGALDAVHDDTWARARAAVDAVRDSDSAVLDVPVSLHVEPGPAAAQLVRRSADADLLVVGSRGRGEVRSALLGSVALHSASAAECPVVVVPLPGRWAEPGVASRVVVGVDGSARSVAALAAALTEAGPAGSVTAVRSHDVTDPWGDAAGAPAAAELQEVHEGALQRMEGQLGELLVASAGDHPDVHRLSLTGPAGAVLVEQASDADLLVVASRGHGEFRGLVFGSVALHCVVHATCPVLVVRPAVRRLPARSPLADAVSSR
jgi:nucleotide-binding universal stress UspA family protein